LLTQLQELPLAYHDRKGATDSTYRIQYDAQSIQWVVFDGVQPILTSSVTVIAMLIVIARIDWQLATIALVIAPLLLLMTRVWGNRLRRQWRSAKELQSTAMSVVQESLSSLRVIKSFGAERREQEKFVAHSDASVRGQLDVAFSQGLFELCSGVLLGIGSAFAIYIGVSHMQSGAITLGSFWLIWSYMAQLLGPLETIGKKVSTLQGAFASADRALAVLDEIPHVIEKPNAAPLVRASGEIKLESVSFSHDGSSEVLKDVSFRIAPGECVGVIGSTGAGKTTIASLLMRFYDPHSGRILLDGADLRDYKLDDLRRQFSVVLQDSVLFSTTIAENISYGRPSATMDEIVAAAQAAEAHEFIGRAPNGYDTQVGQGGMMLSGGERQRIAIARAFLRNSPLLILDEPTSALDVQTEAAIGIAIQRLARGRTTLLITHRSGLLGICDRVAVVEHGTLTERQGDMSGLSDRVVNSTIKRVAPEIA
jgi:ATP-binding cassette, subfamily B, bacterial